LVLTTLPAYLSKTCSNHGLLQAKNSFCQKKSEAVFGVCQSSYQFEKQPLTRNPELVVEELDVRAPSQSAQGLSFSAPRAAPFFQPQSLCLGAPPLVDGPLKHPR
jgi:hypothetical protein